MKLYDPLLLQGLAGIILRLTIVSARGTCVVIKVEYMYIPDLYIYIYLYMVYIPDLSGYISATLK